MVSIVLKTTAANAQSSKGLLGLAFSTGKQGAMRQALFLMSCPAEKNINKNYRLL